MRVRLTGGAAAACIVIYAAAAAAQQPRARQANWDMVFSSSVFRQAERNDAVAALRVWVRMVAERRGLPVNTSVEVVNDVAEVRRRVRAGGAGTLALDTLQYLEVADLPSIRPIFSALRGEQSSLQRYLLLVRDGTGVSTLEALRGKKAIIHANTGANLAQVWLDTLLGEQRLAFSESLFASLNVVTKPSAAVLPVFFGQADAAVVDSPSFAVMKEMNPQLGVKLRSLSTSPQVFEAVICTFGERLEFKDQLIEAMRDLHLDAQGRQILMAFKVNRLVPMDSSALQNVRDLWQKYRVLSHRAAHTPASNPAKGERRSGAAGESQ